MSLTDFAKQAAGCTSVFLHGLFPNQMQFKLGMLVYHRISPTIPGVPDPDINVTPRRFAEQLAGLKEQGFAFPPLSQVLSAREEGTSLPENSVVVTFDDGFESVYLHAWPTLRELDIPATIFVNTAYLDSDEPFPFDPWGQMYRDDVPAACYRPLTISQCHEMLDDGLIELGAHTHTHKDFRGKPVELRKDVEVNVARLEELFGLDQVAFAFPFGRVAERYAGGSLAEAARKAGVRCALTTECEPVDLESDPFHWGRFNVYDSDTGRSIAAKLAGWYGWMPKLKDRFPISR